MILEVIGVLSWLRFLCNLGPKVTPLFYFVSTRRSGVHGRLWGGSNDKQQFVNESGCSRRRPRWVARGQRGLKSGARATGSGWRRRENKDPVVTVGSRSGGWGGGGAGGFRHLPSEMMQTLAPALLTEWKVVLFPKVVLRAEMEGDPCDAIAVAEF